MIRAFQWDLARQVERLEWLLAQLPRYAEWGYQELYLHLEDAVDYPSLPGVARADAYRWDQLRQLVDTASSHGLRVVPIVNLLGHTQYLIKTEEWRDLNELRAPDGAPLPNGQICPLHPRTLEVAERLLHDVTPLCTAGKVHLGLDESFHLGKHPLSRAEVAEVGLATHFARHVQRLHRLATARGLRMGLWADMFALLPDAIPQLPRGLIVYDWYYYAFRRHPRVELRNFAEYDLATPLQAQGAEYWGCPMNGAFRFEPLPIFGERLANAQSWWRRCQSRPAGGFLVTSWEAYRLAIEVTTVLDAAIASFWLEPDIESHVDLLTRGFARVFGSRGAREAARTALAADAYPFSGYAKWELNDRWDVTSTRESVAFSEREARLFRRLATRATPAPLQASLALRAYLAEREAFVRRAAKGVVSLRLAVSKKRGAHVIADLLRLLQEDTLSFASELRRGRQAARVMWTRTRDRRVTGQNEAILQADRRRLLAWQRWLRMCRRDLEQVWSASPLMGCWQLQFVVINFAPAVQRVAVEQLQPDGTWRELRARHTIEFRTQAARPRTRLRRSFAVPVERPEVPLRIAVGGVGEVRVTQVWLTNGVDYRSPQNWRGAKLRRLGRPAPNAGLPNVLSRPGDTLELCFSDLSFTNSAGAPADAARETGRPSDKN